MFHSRNSRCEFGDSTLQERMLRDRIVMGVSDKKLQKRLLEAEKFSKAIEIASIPDEN